MAVDTGAIEQAAVQWLEAATGLPVHLAEQPGAPTPAGDFLTLRLGDVGGVGVPREVHRDVAGAPLGEELEISAEQDGVLALSVQAFTRATTGPTAARALLSRAALALALPTRQGAFAAAGAGVLGWSPIQNLTALIDPSWQGRALLEVSLHVVESASERTGYIETVDLETTLED